MAEGDARASAGRMATKDKRVDGADVRPAGIFHSTQAARLIFTKKARQLLRHLSPRLLPTNLDKVIERDKDIRYSSRIQICSNAFRQARRETCHQ
jgi:hypothetical protein